MSVERRRRRDGSAAYVVRMREMGRQRARVFDLRRDAVGFDLEQRRRRQTGGVAGRERATLGQLHDEWWPIHSRDIAPSTARSYDGLWRTMIEPELGNARLSEITPQAVESWARGATRAMESRSGVVWPRGPIDALGLTRRGNSQPL